MQHCWMQHVDSVIDINNPKNKRRGTQYDINRSIIRFMQMPAMSEE